jgi:DNA mismatch endonuclease (patch repair protein)
MKKRGARPNALTKSEQMARVRNRGTSSELRLRMLLRNHGLRYILRRKLPGSPDLVIPSGKVAVFVDGCFWHGCPRHYRAPATNIKFWREKVQRNMARDTRVDSELRTLGWRVVRVWDHELKRDVRKVLGRIERGMRGAASRQRKTVERDRRTTKSRPSA